VVLVRVLVTGGRDYADAGCVDGVLSGLYIDCAEPLVIVHGGAPGADTLARKWAQRAGVATEPHMAQWHKFGKAAGAIRNQEMVRAGADLVIAFPGGPGTADCVRRARAAGIPVREVS
jgi:hypothetical protein